MKDDAKLTTISTRPPVVWKFEKQSSDGNQHVKTRLLGLSENARPKGMFPLLMCTHYLPVCTCVIHAIWF